MSRPTSRFEGILLFVPFLLAAEKNHPFVQKMIVRGAGFDVGGPEAPPLCADCAACVAPCADALASVLRRSAPSRLVAASPPPLLGFRGGGLPAFGVPGCPDPPATGLERAAPRLEGPEPPEGYPTHPLWNGEWACIARHLRARPPPPGVPSSPFPFLAVPRRP